MITEVCGIYVVNMFALPTIFLIFVSSESAPICYIATVYWDIF